MNANQRMLMHAMMAAAIAALAMAGAARAQGPSARPAPLPKSGPVPREPHFEQKLQAEFKAPPNFNVTLFAGPPIAGYPICVAEATGGVVFVCVDPNLSLSQLKGVGRVVRLVDEDNDGHADRYTVFAEMDSPRGALFDGKTLYVMHPPNLTAYRDDDGDGIAEVKQDIVTGLGFDLDFRGADHSTNNLEMGIDGWLYVAVGDYGFVRAVGSDGTQLQHRGGGIVRVRPDGTHLEMYATGTRNVFDVAIDPFLHVFARDNTNDGEGWDIRLHYLAAGANMGYPNFFQNFPTELFPSLADYGAGAGVGGLWIQDPSWPAGYNNTLFTGDWTLQKIFRHTTAAKGASFAAQQDEFIGVARPSHFTMDDRSNLYVASLSGGQFNYRGDTVGYVVRVNYTGKGPSLPPTGAQTDAQLLATLASANAVHRQHAQQELLSRGRTTVGAPRDALVKALQRAVASTEATSEARVAAMFTLKQMVGAQANATLLQASTAADAHVRELSLRALADRKDELAGVTTAPFVKALRDPDAFVRVQGLVGLERLGAHDAAAAIVPLVGSDDQALSHLAIHALVSLDARDAALKGVDGASPAVKEGSLRALAMMYDEGTVTALLERLARATTATQRAPLLHTLGRLYNREGVWRGDWWTTKPAHLGPYFDPSLWEESPRIRPAIRQALLAASGDELASLVKDFVANQVLPRGAQPLLVAAATGSADQRARVIDALVGSAQLNPNAMPVLAELDRKGPAFHAGVAELIAGEATLGPASISLVRAAALDTTLPPRVRDRALTALSRMPGDGALDVMVDVLARMNPHGGPPNLTGAPAATQAGATNPVETAWRRFVGAPNRRQDLDSFIKLATTAEPAKRVLAYAVLLQSIRNPRTPQDVRDKVQPVLDAAWSDPASAPSLVEAIAIMRVEAQYLDRLRTYQASQKP